MGGALYAPRRCDSQSDPSPVRALEKVDIFAVDVFR